jgi:hypothetical protein
MIYGHYDVQPPEPLELWKSPPFEPRIEGRSIYARGSTDNKGQNFAHLKAVEAYLKTGTPLPCDLTFVIEGEEEVGSENLANLSEKSHRAELKCDAIVVSDTGMPSLKHPALTYALRGIIAFEIKLHGPARDLHSGVFGGAVENPAMALSQPARATARQKRTNFHSRFLRRRRAALGLRAEGIRAPADHGCATAKAARREKIVRRTRLHTDGTAQCAPDFRDQRPDQRLSGQGQQDHRARVGERKNHLPPRAKPTTAHIRKLVCGTSKRFARRPCGWKSKPATARKRISFRRRASRRRRHCAPGKGFRLQAGFDARGRLDPDRERFQKNPRRGFTAARLGSAGRQRAFAQRKIQPGLFRQRPGDERASVAGVEPFRSAMN